MVEPCLPHVEFAYNQTINSATKFFPFEVFYGFNPPTHMDLMHLHMSDRVKLDGKKKAEVVKNIHENARLHIERKTELQYAKQANKGQCELVFKLGDWAWLDTRKESFPIQRRSKFASTRRWQFTSS